MRKQNPCSRSLSFAFVVSALLLTPPCTVQAQTDTTTSGKVFHLGEVMVVGRRDKDSYNTVSARDLLMFNRADASHALNLLSGITLNNVGSRNESTVYIRGFDLRQIPLFVDGVPVYVPYDGYVDLGRFTTADLAEISVAKGFSSVLYGPNTIGGAINLMSRKPEGKLDYSVRSGLMSGKGYTTSLNVGSRQEKFYLLGGGSRLKRDYYRLSGDFKPTSTENGGRRENAYRDDVKFNVKVGLTPSEADEYAVGYVNQQGDKGNPVYAGSDPTIRPRYWRWPEWDKESVYFISRTTVNERNHLNTRIFYDTFKNTLDAYDDATYTTQKKSSSFRSIYDDYTYGASAEVSTEALQRSIVKFAAHFKHDVHRDHNLGEPVKNVVDNTLSFGLESVHRLNDRVSIVPGIAYNRRNSIRADEYNSQTKTIGTLPDNDNAAVDLQVGAFVNAGRSQDVSVTIARKTRFATMKDRYSYKMGAAIPNPDLRSEAAVNCEVAYAFNAQDGKASLRTSLFYSDIRDIIQRVDNVHPPDIYQLQNVGRARFLGGELGLAVHPVTPLKSGLTYSCINRKNTTDPGIKLTDVPDHKVLVYLTCAPVPALSVDLNVECNSSRYTTTAGAKVSGFSLLNGKVSGRLSREVSVEGGTNNLFDKNYTLAEGYPEEGRHFFFNLILGTP